MSDEHRINESSARRIARLFCSRFDKEKFVIVLKGYLDASGTTANQKVVAVAGWAGSEKEWDVWEKAWTTLLSELPPLKKGWHHTDFLNKRRGYLPWRDADYLRANKGLRAAFNSVRLLGTGAAIKRADYEAIWSSGKWNLPRDPYAFCLDLCLEALIQRLHEAPKDDGIAIFVDQDDPEHESLGKRIAAWHEWYVRHNKESKNPNREVSTIYGSRIKYVPLQAADILVDETYRYMFETGIPPFLGAKFVGVENQPVRPLIEDIKGRCYLAVDLFSKARLEDDLEASARGERRPDGMNVDALRRFIPSSGKS